MALPQKPDSFTIEPSRGLLKGRAPLQSDKTHGITDEDVNKCEQWAWMRTLSIFAGAYDVSTWGDNPPQPLEEIWNYVASALYLRFVLQEYSTEKGADKSRIWMEEAHKMIRELLPGQKQRGETKRYFLKTVSGSAGEIQYPRIDYIDTLYIDSSAIEFFPDLDTETSHSETTIHNFETFFKECNITT